MAVTCRETRITIISYHLGEPKHDTPRFNGDTILCGPLYDVLRDGVLVARIYEHPSLYKGGRASVSMRKIAWSGRRPSGYPKNPDPALFFDFVSRYTTAAEVLPECERRVERILQWRRENP